MSNNNKKECKGLKALMGLAYEGQWACEEDYPDHMVPVDLFGNKKTNPDGKQHSCQKCMGYRNSVHNSRIAKAEAYAKSVGIAANTKEWRALPKERRDEVFQIVAGKSNVIPFKLKSTNRNAGLPQGIVTPSEKKVRRESRAITYTPEGWLYAAKDHMKQRGFLKLGKTNDLARRLSEFNTAGDFEMMYWVKVADAKAAERMVHDHFESDHHLREWFKVSLKDATEVMDSVADVVNDPEWEGIVDLGDADES